MNCDQLHERLWCADVESFDRDPAVRTHLADCPDCAQAARIERRISADLSRLRRPYPESVDLVASVLDRISQAASATELVPPRQLAWGAAAAAVALISVAVGMLFDGAALWQAANVGAAWLQAQIVPAKQLLGVLLELASIPFKLLAGMLRAAGPLGSALSALQETTRLPLQISVAMMLITLTTVIGRDFRAASQPREGA